MKYLYLLIACCVSMSLSVKAQIADYASHSVLSSGQWVKISIPETGMYELTDALLQSAGFQHPERVSVWGYGGALQPEAIATEYLSATDDLQEVPVCELPDGRLLFFGVGPVNWSSADAGARVRNHYASAGCYFLKESAVAPQRLDSAAFVTRYYPHPNDYHALYEDDAYAWFSGGRNLFDRHLFGEGVARSYTLPAYASSGSLTVYMSYADYCDAEVWVNDSLVGHILVDASTTSGVKRKAYPDKYSCAAMDVWKFDIAQRLQSVNTITIRQVSGSDMRLDYLSLASITPRPLQPLSGSHAVPQLAGAVACQDLHADGPADMVIIVPANGHFLDEANRLARLHEVKDGLRVRVVTASQLYNEFSSGTPDANAYRRYLRMLRDRAATEADQPRYLLLFGDGLWDNRLCSSHVSTLDITPDDLLLCFESDNSFSVTQCFVSDDFFCMLDDGEGIGMQLRDYGDLAVGRLPARTAQDAKVLVDKIESYLDNSLPGTWQNTLCFMGDDGDNNRHMRDAESVADSVAHSYDAFHVKKIYWDTYDIYPMNAGYRYPGVTKDIKTQMKQGALVMNYSGHGSDHNLSHEIVMTMNDFTSTPSARLPLWVTASCNIMPFDALADNIGETLMLWPDGGAIAFFGTVHTVYATKNMPINRSFMHHVLSMRDGRRTTLGEAARQAKTDILKSKIDVVENKLQYVLLGDPALSLAFAQLPASIDSINGQPVGSECQQLTAGQLVTVSGHIPGGDDFCGVVNLMVEDAEQLVVCRQQDASAERPFTFDDRSEVVFTGNDTIVNGYFKITFRLPLDIRYADGPGRMLVYAVNNDHTLAAHGACTDFVMTGGDAAGTTGDEGPAITCYLDSPTFTDGDKVSSTPFFYAQIYDADGINVSGNGFGHDMQLIIDGDLLQTYTLNDQFLYDLGNFTRGEVGFTMPWLPDGEHQLVFRAWDVLNHSSTATLRFTVDSFYRTAGIQRVYNDDWFAQRRQQRQVDVYDATGRFVGHCLPRRAGLYIMKNSQGAIKKIMVRGNN